VRLSSTLPSRFELQDQARERGLNHDLDARHGGVGAAVRLVKILRIDAGPDQRPSSPPAELARDARGGLGAARPDLPGSAQR
jgi:hypothetical protein